VKKAAIGKENIEQTKKKSEASITEEKERLQSLEKEYARRIQHLKMATAKRKIQARKDRINKGRKSSSEIPRLEKIEISQAEQEEEMIEKPTKRRRSLIDLNPSTKPKIEKKPDSAVIPVKTFISAKNNVTKATVIKVSNSQQLKKLKQLLVSEVIGHRSHTETATGE
jgi:hypothetical protein